MSFCPFMPLRTPKIKIFKKWKKTWIYLLFTHVYQKLWSNDVQFLRYAVQQTDRRMDRKRYIERWVPHLKTAKKKKLKGSKWTSIKKAARKPFKKKLNEFVVESILKRRSEGLRASRKLIMKKAVAMYDDMVKEVESNEEFQATMPLQRKHLRVKKTQIRSQISWYLLFYLNAVLPWKHPYNTANIIAMDENPICADMVSATTADDTSKKTVTIKTTTQKKLVFGLPNSKRRWYKICDLTLFSGVETVIPKCLDDHWVDSYLSE